MHPTATAPTIQLLAWIDEEPRGYAETLERWQDLLPALAVWEDALADSLVRVTGRSVLLTVAGREVSGTRLRSAGEAEASPHARLLDARAARALIRPSRNGSTRCRSSAAALSS